MGAGSTQTIKDGAAGGHTSAAPSHRLPGTHFKESLFPRWRATTRLLGSTTAGAPEGVRGRRWGVTIIAAGPSLNNVNYPAEALREAVPIFEGAKVFAYEFAKKGKPKAEHDHLPDEVKAQDQRGLFGNAVGVLEGVHFNEETQTLDGDLVVVDPDVRTKMLEALDAGKLGADNGANLFGLSIDATGTKTPDGASLERFISATSVDLVTTPAAGGRINRLIEAVQEDPVATTKTADIKAAAPAAPAAPAAVPTGAPADGKRPEPAAPAAPPGLPIQPVQEDGTAPAKAATISALADRLAGATPTEQEAILKKIAQECQPMSQPASASTPSQPAAPAPSPQMTEAAKRLAESVDKLPANLRESARVLAGGLGVNLQEADRRDQTITSLQETIKAMAIENEMGRVASSLNLREGVIPDVMKLADLSTVQVAMDNRSVSGLREAVEAVVKSRPWLVAESKTAAPAAPPSAGAPAPAPAAPARARESAPAPLGQAVAFRESAPDDVTDATERAPIPGPYSKMTDAQRRATWVDLVQRKDPKSLAKAKALREAFPSI